MLCTSLTPYVHLYSLMFRLYLSPYSYSVCIQLYLSCIRTSYQRSAVKLMLMMFSFMLALLTGLSRITDNKHHPTDVLSGWIIGGAVAFVVVSQYIYYCRLLSIVYNYMKGTDVQCTAGIMAVFKPS